jgi:hypothetical protein
MPVAMRRRTVAGLLACLGLAGAGGAIAEHSTRAAIPSAVFVTWQSGEYRQADQAQYFAGPKEHVRDMVSGWLTG